MATLKEIKNRIGSVKTVHKITKSMKLISASKSKTAQNSNAALKPYSDHIYNLVGNLWTITDPEAHPLLKKNHSSKQCHIIVATDKGLCGSLLNNIEDYLIKDGIYQSINNQYIIIGKRGADLIIKHGAAPTAVFELGLRRPSFGFVKPIVKLIIRDYLGSEYSRVTIFYTSFINAFKQLPSKRIILPVSNFTTHKIINDIAIYEPSADEVLDVLLPRYLEVQLYQLILESVASEHAARMVAMDQATENAEETIDELTLIFNKTRQERITRELLEITTTVSAL